MSRQRPCTLVTQRAVSEVKLLQGAIALQEPPERLRRADPCQPQDDKLGAETPTDVFVSVQDPRELLRRGKLGHEPGQPEAARV